MTADAGTEGASQSLYRHYHAWKAWGEMFATSADQAGYYRGELRDLRIDGADVLEIGFGAGSCLAWMAGRGARLSGSEISDVCCAAARAHGVAVLPVDLPARAGQYADSFDTILAFDVIEHLPIATVSAYLTACETMLRRGGRMLLRFPNAQSPFGLYPQAGDPTHLTAVSGQIIALLIAGSGLRVVRYSGSWPYLGRPLSPRWLKRVLRRMAQVLIGAVLRFVYATDIPYDPVVVIVLERAL